MSICDKALNLGIDLGSLPNHIAIIMDGNGRWAQGKGLARLAGHRQGYLNLKTVLTNSDKLGIKYLTVYGFSVENWRRPEAEVKGLMRLIQKAAAREKNEMERNNVQVKLSGHRSGIPKFVLDTLEECEESTKNNTGIVFNLAINYGGRLEILDAIKKIAAEKPNLEEISEEDFKKYLYQPEIPDPDLIIRTAGEMRWSNFLLWQSAYTELFVTQASWPDFSEDHLIQAVLEYQKRQRKFGGLK